MHPISPEQPRSRTARRQDFYADPLIYDVLHSTGTAKECSALEKIAAAFEAPSPASTNRTGARTRRWFEPACGSGRYCIELARLGHDCTGIDMNAAMIAFARKAARAAGVQARAKFLRATMQDFALPERADAACNLINSIRHLMSDHAMLSHLRCVRRSLRDGGIYVVGMSVCAYGWEQPTEDVWKATRGALRVTQAVQYIPPVPEGAHAARGVARCERVVSHLTVRDASGAGGAIRERHVDSAYALRTYSLAQWRALLDRARWEIAGVCDQDGDPATLGEVGYFLFVLRPAHARR